MEESRPPTDFFHVHGTQQKHQSSFCLKCFSRLCNQSSGSSSSARVEQLRLCLQISEKALSKTDLLFKHLQIKKKPHI